jgi:hypothetical protein
MLTSELLLNESGQDAWFTDARIPNDDKFEHSCTVVLVIVFLVGVVDIFGV